MKNINELQKIANNPDVVEAVIAKAEREGRVVSRNQILKAIDDRKRVENELYEANQNLDDAQRDNAMLKSQIAILQHQVTERQNPEVIEREVIKTVIPSDYDAAKKRIAELERLERLHSSDTQNLRKQLETTRKELDRAKGILGMDKTMQDVRRDVQYLISATNSFVRQYGGLTWTAESFEQVDEPTMETLRKAVRNLGTFSNSLMNALEEIK